VGPNVEIILQAYNLCGFEIENELNAKVFSTSLFTSFSTYWANISMAISVLNSSTEITGEFQHPHA
jgi:hypothetical protein